MKKLKFLFFALTAFACSNAWGITNGEYFIMNVGSGYFLGGANDWGTQASLVEHPQLFGISPSGETYTLDSFTYNNATNHYLTGTYVDGAATGFYFTEVSSGSGIYTISTAKGSGYLTAASSDALSVVANNGTSSSSTLAQWKFITKLDLLDACKSATKANPVDMTGFIKAANFSRNQYNKNFSSEATWTVEGYNTTDAAANSNIAGGDNKNLCAESWRSSNGFNVHQTLTGLPNGTYKFRAQAAVTEYTVTGKDLPVVYCNDAKVTFNSMVHGEDALSQLSNEFTNGEYYTDFVEVLVLDKTLTFGFKGSRSDTWNAWDNFQLYFVEPLDLSTVASALSEALSTANTLTSSAMQSTALAGLNSVITAYTGKEYDNEEDYQTAIAAVNAAIAVAKASVAIYQQVALLNEKVKGYDTAGQAAYATTLAAYNNGTLTTYEDALAAYRTAVKAQTTAGSDMTDAIINPNFDGNINGWTDTYTTGNHGFQSNKSYTNGAATINQFMECWVGSGSLADGKLSQVISGLPEGEYTMSAAIISCRQGQPSLTLTGVYIFAQSDALFKSEACATGDEKPEIVSFDFKMKGESLELGLMTDGTNCNWVAFDNVKLTYNGPLKGNIYQDQLNEALKNYSDRSDEHANGDVKSAYATAYSAAVTAGETNGESDAYYQDALSALETADAAMTASADAYASLKTAFTPYVSNTAAATLVAKAQGIYEAAAMTPDEVNAYVLQFGLDIFIATNDSPFTGSAVGEGTFYLYNLKSRKFMNGGNDWGTQVSLADAGQPMELAASGTGYTINSLISNGGGSHFVGTGGYLDATETVLTFKKIADGIYTISWDGGTKMYGYDGSTTVVATQTAESAGSYWQLVTAEQICAAAVENGTEAAPFDVTSLVKDYNFGRNNTLFDAWVGGPAKNGANDNMNAEKFNTTFDVYQTLSGLPNGKYIVKAQAFYRAGGGGTPDTAENAVLYANNDSVAIENINAEASATSGNGFTKQAGSKFVPDSQADASAVFSAGKYDNNEVEAIVTDGTLKIGFWKEKAVGNDWTIFDNVRLYYCGPVLAKGTVKMTYVDYDDPDTAAGEVTEAVAGYNKISGGTVAAANAIWGVTKIIYLQVDITDVAITNGKVTLSAECSGSTDNKRVTTWGVGYNTSTWSENLTYNTADRRITLCGETVTTTKSTKDTYETLSWDITDAFAGGNKVATILVYETAAGGGNFKNPTVAVKASQDLSMLIIDGVAGKAAGETLTIDLDEGEEYPLSSPVDAGLVNLVINGNGAVVKVSADAQITGMQGIEINDVNFDCAEATVAPVALSANPDSCLVGARFQTEGTALQANAFYNTGAIVISNCNFSEVKTPFVSANKREWNLAKLVISNVIAQFDVASGIDSYINWYGNAPNLGSIKDIVIENSTLYNIVENNSNYFLRYQNSSNSQPQKAWPTPQFDGKCSWTMTNNTFVNLPSNTNFASNYPNKNNVTLDFKGNIFYNTWRLQKIASSAVKNFTNADNAIKGITNTVDGTDAAYYATEDTELSFTVPTTALDLDDIDFTGKFSPNVDSYSYQHRLGDPRWITAYPVTIKSGLVTFCAPTAATIATGLTAWYAASFNDTYVQMEQLEGDVIPANMGVILAGDNGDYVLPVSTSSAAAVDNLLIGVNTKTMLAPTTDGNTNYVLVSGEFCPFTGTATVPAGKAYLSVPAASGTLGLRFGDATVIEDVSVETTGGMKVNTLGQAVGDGYKGIVIMNGKKYMMK